MYLYWTDSEGIVRYRGRFTGRLDMMDAARNIFNDYSHHTPVVFYTHEDDGTVRQITREEVE